MRRFTSRGFVFFATGADSLMLPRDSQRREVNTRLRNRSHRPEDIHQAAKDALVQFNVMVDQGVKPNVMMYTSLIHKMGLAGLEDQAYKLFSRMLEEGMTPLPETYVALRSATKAKRLSLIDSISRKIEAQVEQLPAQLAAAEKKSLESEEEESKKEFHRLMNLPSGTKLSDLLSDGTASTFEGVGNEEKKGKDAPYATMKIDGPEDVWQTQRQIEEFKKEQDDFPPLTAEERGHFSSELDKLHEEELRIMLSIKRQLRHGTKEELISRVLSNYSASQLEQLFARRKKYFGAVRRELETQLEEEAAMKKTETQPTPKKVKVPEMTSESLMDIMSDPLDDRVPQASSPSSAIAPPPTSNEASSTATDDPAADDVGLGEYDDASEEINRYGLDVETGDEVKALTPREQHAQSPNVLYTPWGMLKKPLRVPARLPSPRNLERDKALELSNEELLKLHTAARLNELDLVPRRLLRRYARQFVLKWKRGASDRLMHAVQWHVLTFPPDGVSPELAKAAHAELEKEGVNQTLDTFEALELFARRCENLQVVDSMEIVRAMKRAIRSQDAKHKQQDIADRKQRHLEAAEALRAAALEYEPKNLQPDPKSEKSRILGLDGVVGDDSPPTAQELPPWAVRTGHKEAFQLRTGTFGDVQYGEFVETSPGKFNVRPNHEARQQFTVDIDTLPAEYQKKLHHEMVDAEQAEIVRAKEVAAKMSRPKNVKYIAFYTRANQKKQHEKEKLKASGVQPIPKKLRMSQLLQRGRVKPKLNFEVRKFDADRELPDQADY